MANAEIEHAAGGAPMVGDHLALDLLNTQARAEDGAVDYWTSGEDVLGWLARHGIAPASGMDEVDRTALLTQAIALRTLARRLLVQRKEQGEVGEVDELNAWLQAYASAPMLARDEEGRLVMRRQVRADPLASLLGPVAEAVAGLLAEGDFSLVKQCEHPDCILWFYDRTKAHKRRWCSMALCGNRHKAAQFRKRSAAAA